MVKPDGVQRCLVGRIIDKFEQKGLKLIGLKMVMPTEKLLKEHYSDLSKKPFYKNLIKYMSSGPVVAMVWEGLNTVKLCRSLLGATNPVESNPGTLRGDYCVQVGRNIVHASDSSESACKEISLWFTAEELIVYSLISDEWVNTPN